jgi:hypothetical protein
MKSLTSSDRTPFARMLPRILPSRDCSPPCKIMNRSASDRYEGRATYSQCRLTWPCPRRGFFLSPLTLARELSPASTRPCHPAAASSKSGTFRPERAAIARRQPLISSMAFIH